MNPTDPGALGLAVLVLIPGFVSIKVWDLLVPSERRDLSAASLEVFTYGAINFAVLVLPLLALDVLGAWASEHQVRVYLLWVFVLFVAPCFWPIALRRLLKADWLKKRVIDPIPKPRDYVFGKGEGYWVILHMKDGRRIGGRYDTGSFASSFPNDEQLYLEEVWELDARGAFLGSGSIRTVTKEA